MPSFIPVVFFLALVVVVAGAFRLAPRVLLVVLYLLRVCLPMLYPVRFLPDFFDLVATFGFVLGLALLLVDEVVFFVFLHLPFW